MTIDEWWNRFALSFLYGLMVIRRRQRQTIADVCNFHSHFFSIYGLMFGIFMIFI